MEFKKIVGTNLSRLRKSRKITQLELAEMFSYSDKAVSKWEKGETLPDMETLYQIANFYGVSLDYLTKEHDENDVPNKKSNPGNIIATTLLLVCFIWLLAILVYLWLGHSDGQGYYQCFIWPIPASFLIFFLSNNRWGNKNYNFYFASILLWTLILAAYLQFKDYGERDFVASWMLFILGIPIQAAIVIWSFSKRNPFLALKDDILKLRNKRREKKLAKKANRKEGPIKEEKQRPDNQGKDKP